VCSAAYLLLYYSGAETAGASRPRAYPLLRSYNILAGVRLLLSLPFRKQLTEAIVPTSAASDQTVKVVASEAPPRRLA
jgi:hypothetical protein